MPPRLILITPCTFMNVLTEVLISHAHKQFALSHTMSQWQTKERKQSPFISQTSSEPASCQQELKAIPYFIAIKQFFVSHPVCFIGVVTSASQDIKKLCTRKYKCIYLFVKYGIT